MDSARRLSQLLQEIVEAFRDTRQLGLQLDTLRWDGRLHAVQLERERDQPLLRSVVEIALDSPARLIGGGDDPGAGGSELGPALGVGDRSADELRELADPRLRVEGERGIAPGRGGYHTPQPAADDDRTAD